jgi:hypothetical protein
LCERKLPRYACIERFHVSCARVCDIDRAVVRMRCGRACARTLAAPFGFPAKKLFACHSAIVTGAEEEFGGR